MMQDIIFDLVIFNNIWDYGKMIFNPLGASLVGDCFDALVILVS